MEIFYAYIMLQLLFIIVFILCKLDLNQKKITDEKILTT